MRKTLLSLLAASSLWISTANAQESQELYPDLKGNHVVSVEIHQSSGVPVLSIEFNTDDDYFGDIKYFYSIGSTEKNLIILTYPFAVTIDKDRDQQVDEDETIYLVGRTSEYSKLEKDTREPYPNLKGDYVSGILFDQFKNDLVAYIQYNTDNDKVADIMYSHKIHKVVENSILLETPFAVYFDRNGNGVFEFNSERIILEEGMSVKPIKREFKI